jgi:hypothetical protein
MGNKVVTFTEEQFEDYQVSDTHTHNDGRYQNPSGELVPSVLKKFQNQTLKEEKPW